MEATLDLVGGSFGCLHGMCMSGGMVRSLWVTAIRSLWGPFNVGVRSPDDEEEESPQLKLCI
jgi:hypothetical protein